MSRIHRFKSRVETIGALKDPTADFTSEPSFFEATPRAVRENAGAQVQNFMDEIESQGWSPGEYVMFVFNTGLFRGAWPTAVPFWHVDGDTSMDISYPFRDDMDHAICTISRTPDASVSTNTVFAVGDVRLKVPKRIPKRVKNKFPWWHSQIEKQVGWGDLERVVLEDGAINQFDKNGVHQTQMASLDGDRLLIAASRYSRKRGRVIGSRTPLDYRRRAYIPGRTRNRIVRVSL